MGQPFISLEAEINDLIDKEDFSSKLSKIKNIKKMLKNKFKIIFY